MNGARRTRKKLLKDLTQKNINDYMKLLNKIQKELKAPKSQYNSFGKYYYRNCEDILEAVKPLLGDGILTISDEVVNIGNHNYVKATATLTESANSTHAHLCDVSKMLRGATVEGFKAECTCGANDGVESVSVTAYAREAVDQKGMNDSQITGSTSSYARKYALNGLFCIDDTKDSDTTNTHDKNPSNAKNAPKTPTAEEATNSALDKIKSAGSIKELMELDERIKNSKFIPEDKKIDLSFELQEKILTFDPTSD